MMQRSSMIAMAFLVLMAMHPQATSQSPTRTESLVPKLDAVAETRLLMEGLARANFSGLNRLLSEKPTQIETWQFVRGQALLIAETGNLLMLRPPKTRAAQDLWMSRAAELRSAGVELAKAAGAKDYAESRARVANLANACNRCHVAFRVAERIIPLADER